MPSRTAAPRRRLPTPLLFAGVLLLAVLPAASTSCAPFREEEGPPIEPALGASPADSRLGGSVLPLSAGPGEKAAPRQNPSDGGTVAFVLNGQPAVKHAGASGAVTLGRDEALPRAERLEWIGPSALAVLYPSEEASGTYSLRVIDGNGTSRRVADGVTGAAPGAGGLVAAVQTSSGGANGGATSRLLLIPGDGTQPRLFPGELPGRVTGLSVAPDGARAVLAVRRVGVQEVWVYRFSDGALQQLARLQEGLGILGAPQMAVGGVYFVAGEEEAGGDAAYALYEISRGRAGGQAPLPDPAPVESVGEGFVAASVRVSPDGERLAILGRRNSGAPVELYVLELASGDLRAVTSNEGMEIRTSPEDLAWTRDGGAVLLVARGMLSGTQSYDAPAAALRSPFYNLYEVPVHGDPGEER
jgi:TolB protein